MQVTTIFPATAVARVDRLKGKAQMLTGRAHWATSAVAIKKFEQTPPHMIPQGAYRASRTPLGSTSRILQNSV